MTAKELLRTWEERDSRYAKLKYDLAQAQIEAVRVWRCKEVMTFGVPDNLYRDAVEWTPPPRII